MNNASKFYFSEEKIHPETLKLFKEKWEVDKVNFVYAEQGTFEPF